MKFDLDLGSKQSEISQEALSNDDDDQNAINEDGSLAKKSKKSKARKGGKGGSPTSVVSRKSRVGQQPNHEDTI